MKVKNFLWAIFLIVFITNCKDEPMLEIPSRQYQYYQIPIWSYSERHFFLNEIYADANLNIFNNYYNNPTPLINPYYQIKKVEIWKSVIGIVNAESEIRANTFINLGPRTKYGYTNEKNTGQVPIMGVSEIGRRFVLLEENKDYVLNKATGLISVKEVLDNEVLCAAYTIEGFSSIEEDDIQYGDFINDVDHTNNEVTVLKMIKPPNLQPAFRTAWKLQLRNIYGLPFKNITKENFELGIYMIENGKLIDEIAVGERKEKLISLFGLDRLDDRMNFGRDGKFDFESGRTIMPETCEIIFPTIEPFGKNLPSAFSNAMRHNFIYDTIKYYAQQQESKFFIGVKYYLE